jgi:predicted nucleic acid-binding protein
MSVKVVSNSSPLIYLTKLGKLELLRKVFGEVIIPEEVFKEVVVRGKEEGFPDARVIEKAVERGWLKVRKAQRRLEEDAPELDRGEVEVISLAREIGADWCSWTTRPEGAFLRRWGSIRKVPSMSC